MKILMAASEAYPFVSTGGLAGVVGSLPIALENAGHQVSLIIPYYSEVTDLGDSQRVGGFFLTSTGEEFGMTRTILPGSSVEVFLVSRDEYFGRSGVYGPDSGSGFQDNSARFSFFSRAVAAACESIGAIPDVLHCHDWQTGLVAAYLRNYRKPAVVFTVHNLHYQGNFAPDEYEVTSLPLSMYSLDALEFFGMFSFMKSGVVFADQVTTVSPTYAREILTPPFGEGLDGLFRERAGALTGILDGIDSCLWDPSDDDEIACSFSADASTPRKLCRADLTRERGLTGMDGRMLVGVVSRLTGQKGLDLLVPIVGRMIDEGMSLVILGTGEKNYQDMFAALARKHPGRISVEFAYDDVMARRIFAGCDILLMPSRFEPCGIAQMMGMRYGAVPVVRKTGGLADTVTDVEEGGCGFVFEDADPDDLLAALLRASEAFHDRRFWSRLVRRCMTRDNSWASRIPEYEEVYRKAIETRSGR